MKKILSMFILIALALASCGAENDAAATDSMPAEYVGKTNPLDASAAAAGAEIFKINCEACHGVQGRGDGPAGVALDPQPKDLAVFAPTVGDDYLYWRINAGKDGTSMMAWNGALTDEQIWQVVAFIRTLK